MPKRNQGQGQIVLFPSGDNVVSQSSFPLREQTATAAKRISTTRQVPVVLSGSYRKDFEGLRKTYEELRDLGCEILSPSNVTAVSEIDGFVYMEGEQSQNPDSIEERHLNAIQRAQFVWLHAPSGYVGPTAALEVGFAHAAGVPVFAQEVPSDQILRSFVKTVGSPSDVLRTSIDEFQTPAPALKAFQEYYRRVAVQRGYNTEGPKDCLLLMVEEVGELARALRKREKLVRHGSFEGLDEAQELADVFLYVVHMANVLDVDLSKCVRQKELINLQKFLRK